MTTVINLALWLLALNPVDDKVENVLPAPAKADFTYKIRDWDGFGFNYVETSQTFDYEKWPQDYGGFRFLQEKDKKHIIDLVFGSDGLKPGLVKMFLDPLHQKGEGQPFDHETTTRNMVYFVYEGLKLTRQRGDDFSIITTMYGPPAYITKQKVLRGRDLDPAQKDNLATYFIDWAKYLKSINLPIKYISLHNEGEDWYRWPVSGDVGAMMEHGHDYNFYWSPEQVVDIVKLMRRRMDKEGLKDVGVTNGEFTNWYRFNAWGFAGALEKDKKAMQDLSLITSHGFYVGPMEANHWFGPHSSSGTDRLRAVKPSLHSWTTSTAWNHFTRDSGPRKYIMNQQFIKEVHNTILDAKVNGIIPWAGIQTASQWNKPDPNPGCAIRVYDDGTYEIQKAYYYYKQVSRAGQPGMAVVDASVMSSELSLLAFGSNGTKNPDALIIVNMASDPRKIAIEVKGSKHRSFNGFLTSGTQIYEVRNTASKEALEGENYKSIGKFDVKEGVLQYEAPAGSVTTFFGL